jgi:hypothetical protein
VVEAAAVITHIGHPLEVVVKRDLVEMVAEGLEALRTHLELQILVEVVVVVKELVVEAVVSVVVVDRA